MTEHAEAAMLMRAVRGAVDVWPELRWFAAVPNGGHRSKRAAVAMKAEGVNPGVPDYLMPVQRGGYVGLAIELKTDKGRVSPDQRDWLAHLQEQGWQAVVARGWEEAWGVVRDYMAADGPERDVEAGVGFETNPRDPEDRRPANRRTERSSAYGKSA